MRWAVVRSGLGHDDVVRSFPKFENWVSKTGKPPTLKQLESFARKTRTPFGMLLLDEPPTETLPVPDFRKMPQGASKPLSPDLLDMVHICERRQDWYRGYQEAIGASSLDFVGSLDLNTPVAEAGRVIRTALGFDVPQRSSHPSWTEALRALIDLVEDAGILVMVSGIVGNSTRRGLDPTEFRGFALVDDLAPLVFVNGADTKAAQIFTLAHETAHVWLGKSAVSNARLSDRAAFNPVETWCNAVAAEVLVPIDAFRKSFKSNEPFEPQLRSLAQKFRVSTLVILRRTVDAGFISWPNYETAYAKELDRVLTLMAEQKESSSGGNFYNTLPIRTSRRFAEAVVISTLEGRTMYRDAYRLLGVRKSKTFSELSHSLGVA